MGPGTQSELQILFLLNLKKMHGPTIATIRLNDFLYDRTGEKEEEEEKMIPDSRDFPLLTLPK